MMNSTPIHTKASEPDGEEQGPACVMVFNASDPSGAGGLAAPERFGTGALDPRAGML